jgi:uncharacterized C2H2 Zn-finger protein
MANENTPKNALYNCEKCQYITNNKTDYSRHLTTAKHKILTDGKQKTQKNAPHVCACGNIYVHQSSLCKHRKKCPKVASDSGEENRISFSYVETPENVVLQPLKRSKNSQLVKEPELATQDNTICKLLNEMNITNKQLIELLKEKTQQLAVPTTTTVNNNTTNHNTQININMFLNENCKDAITFQDFVKSIQPTVEDVLYITKHGNKQGLTKIISSALGQLEVVERPIHCTDLKRHTTYVKKHEGWIKENDQRHMKLLSTKTQHECMKLALNILDENPKYSVCGTEEYEERIKMMTETTAEPDHSLIAKTVEEQTHLIRSNKIMN